MAVPQLTGFVLKEDNDPLISESPSPIPTLDTKPSVRFEVEHVLEEEPVLESTGGHLSLSPLDVSSGEHTFGYRTLDAAPTSAYYKDSMQSVSERRPTLKDLMEGGRQAQEIGIDDSKVCSLYVVIDGVLLHVEYRHTRGY